MDDHVCVSGVLLHLIITAENQKKNCSNSLAGQQKKHQFLGDKTNKQPYCWMCVCECDSFIWPLNHERAMLETCHVGYGSMLVETQTAKAPHSPQWANKDLRPHVCGRGRYTPTVLTTAIPRSHHTTLAAKKQLRRPRWQILGWKSATLNIRGSVWQHHPGSGLLFFFLKENPPSWKKPCALSMGSEGIPTITVPFCASAGFDHMRPIGTFDNQW